MKIQFSNTIIDKIQTMKDGGLKLTLITRELPPEEEFKVFQLRKQESDILIDEPILEGSTKTPAEYMEKIISWVKDKLN